MIAQYNMCVRIALPDISLEILFNVSNKFWMVSRGTHTFVSKRQNSWVHTFTECYRAYWIKKEIGQLFVLTLEFNQSISKRKQCNN